MGEYEQEMQASEVRDNEENLSTSTSEVDKITLDDYLKKVKVHPGLVASFRVEIRRNPEIGVPKSMEGWANELQIQSRRTYK